MTICAGQTQIEVTVPKTIADPAPDPLSAGTQDSVVTSFKNRTGAVVPQAGDYTAAMVGADAAGTAAAAISTHESTYDHSLIADAVQGKSNLTTQYRSTYVNAAGEIAESSSLVTDAGGVWTFSSFPVGPSAAPTTDYQLANKKYVDDTAVAGSSNLTTQYRMTYVNAPGVLTESSTLLTDASGNLTVPTLNANYLQLNTSAGVPSHSEGLMYYDNVNNTWAMYNDVSDVTLQVGQELWLRVKNNTGSPINNGDVVYISGIDSGIPTVGLADASSASTSLATIAIATHDIANSSEGYCTRIGTVRDIDTSGCSAGQIMYLSATTPGARTSTPPTSPNYRVRIGNCGVIDAVNGTIEVHINMDGNTSDVIKIFNGQSLEPPSIAVTSNGTTITLSLEQDGGGDLSLFFNGGFSVLDTTPAATVSLTAGTDTVPVLNYVYVPQSTKTLTASTSGFPSAQHFPVATVLCQSAASAQTDGAYKVHQWSEDLSDSNDQGHISHVNSWIRGQNATWISGVAPTFTGSGTATLNMSATSGVVRQLHSQSVPTTSSPATFHIVNDETTAYTQTTNLADIQTDSTGTSLGNKSYALIVWGSISANGVLKWFVNKPAGSYNSATAARNDISGYADYTFPSTFKGTAFLVHRLVVSANAGFTSFTIDSGADDLRGSTPNAAAGGSGGSGADSVQGASNITTQYRMTFASAVPGQITESSSIVTDATGALGIGGAPLAKTHIFGAASGVALLAQVSDGYGIKTTTSGASKYALRCLDSADAVTYFSVNHDGFVGVGIASAYASEKFAVDGAIYANGSLTAKGSCYFGAHDGADEYFFERFSSGAPYAYLYSGSVDNNVRSGWQIRSRNSNGALYTSINIEGRTDSSADTTMHMTGTGQVLIGGITSAYGSEMFAVNGDVNVQGLKTPGSHPTNYKTVYVDTDTGLLYSQNGGAGSGDVLGASNLTTQYRGVFVDSAGTVTESSSIVTDSAGNLGIGSSPRGWNSTYSSVDIGGNFGLIANTSAGPSASGELAQNAYLDTGGSWRYISTDETSRYRMFSGTHQWFYAGSGTAGAVVSWTEALNISNSGVATFAQHPVGPSSAPTTDYQLANKKYVDDNIPASTGRLLSVEHIQGSVKAETDTSPGYIDSTDTYDDTSVSIGTSEAIYYSGLSSGAGGTSGTGVWSDVLPLDCAGDNLTTVFVHCMRTNTASGGEEDYLIGEIEIDWANDRIRGCLNLQLGIGYANLASFYFATAIGASTTTTATGTSINGAATTGSAPAIGVDTSSSKQEIYRLPMEGGMRSARFTIKHYS